MVEKEAPKQREAEAKILPAGNRAIISGKLEYPLGSGIDIIRVDIGKSERYSSDKIKKEYDQICYGLQRKGHTVLLDVDDDLMGIKPLKSRYLEIVTSEDKESITMEVFDHRGWISRLNRYERMPIATYDADPRFLTEQGFDLHGGMKLGNTLNEKISQYFYGFLTESESSNAKKRPDMITIPHLPFGTARSGSVPQE